MAADEVDRDFPKQRTVRHHSLGKMRNRNVCYPLDIGSHWALGNRRRLRARPIDCKLVQIGANRYSYGVAVTKSRTRPATAAGCSR